MRNIKQDYFDFLYKHIGNGKILRPDIQHIASHINEHYQREEKVKENGSIRIIDKPSSNLRTIQRRILIDIRKINNDQGIIPNQVFGLGGSGQKQNVLPHKQNRYVFRVDLKKFFNSIDYTKVTEAFRYLGCSDEEAIILTKLTTYNYYIPQGVPTSPLLASLCLRKCDKDIEKLCNSLGMTYTRYLDDMTMSGKSKITDTTQRNIKNILSQEGLTINSEKTKVFDTENESCKITGIILRNGKIITEYHHGERKHDFIKKHTPINKNTNASLVGVLEWIRNIDPKYYNTLVTEQKCPDCI